jgi:hypothetical protein
MKTFITLIAVLFTTLTQAQVLDARPFSELLKKIEASTFTYKETGKLHGYISTQSCLFLSDDIAIFKNYCYPARKYPARGYTIITREWGITNIYQEELTDTLTTRQIGIDEFPVYLEHYLGEPLPEYTLSDLNGIITEFYPRYFPGCWSTNFSKYSETNEAKCTTNAENVLNFDGWATETQAIVNDEKVWLEMLETIEAKLIH